MHSDDSMFHVDSNDRSTRHELLDSNGTSLDSELAVMLETMRNSIKIYFKEAQHYNPSSKSTFLYIFLETRIYSTSIKRSVYRFL